MRFTFTTLFFLIFSIFYTFAQTGILPEELFEKIKNQEDILILDIRPMEQYSDSNKIPEAVHIEFDKLATELKARGLSYSKKIVVYDRTGNVGRIAVSFLKKMLYSNVSYIIGGYLAWKDNLKKMELGIPENEKVPFGTSNSVILDSLYHVVLVDSLFQPKNDEPDPENEK